MATPPRHSAASGPDPDETRPDHTDAEDTATEDTDTEDTIGSGPDPRRRRGLTRFDLSVTQLVATGLAATTATVAASFLGVAGTVVGAALFSIMTAVGKAVYEQSLSRTRDRVRGAVPVLGPRSATRSLPVTRTASHPTTSHPTTSHPTGSPAQVPPELPAPAPVRTVVWKRAAFGAVSVFAVVLAVVTGVEAVAGRPISDVVRGESGGGTTFFGDNQVRTRTTTVPPTTPTVTVTVTPKVEVTTPTVTQTAPPVTQTNTPSGSSGSTTEPGAPSTSVPTSPAVPASPGRSTSRGR